MAGDWDSVDPGDTYYGLRGTSCATTPARSSSSRPARAPRAPSSSPTSPTSLGKPSDDNKTWTYTLRDGLKYEDGTPITSKDIKYGVARQLDKDDVPQRSDVLQRLPGRTSPRATRLQGQEPRRPQVHRDAGRQDHRLPAEATGFSGFDYFAQLPATAPVPQAKDTGTKYKENVVSSGPYKFASYEPGKRIELVRNPNTTRPPTRVGRKALPDKITVEFGLNAADLDNRLHVR